MNFAALFKEKEPEPPQKETPRHMKPGWISLKERPKTPLQEEEKEDPERFQKAAVALRRNWDRHHAEGGDFYDYDYESPVSSDEEEEEVVEEMVAEDPDYELFENFKERT
jgi:hypothetical protein